MLDLLEIRNDNLRYFRVGITTNMQSSIIIFASSVEDVFLIYAHIINKIHRRMVNGIIKHIFGERR